MHGPPLKTLTPTRGFPTFQSSGDGADVQLERAGGEHHERGQVRFYRAQFGHYLIELGLAMCLGSCHELHARDLS